MYEEHITENFESPRAFRHAMRTKAAPKLGRTIGAAAKAGKRVVPFDPNPRNADNDKTVQDGTIWERPAVNVLASGIEKLANSVKPEKIKRKDGGLYSGSKSSLADRLFDREGDEDIPEEWYERADLIDLVIAEQIEIALGLKRPENATFSRELIDGFQSPPGKKKPSVQYILKHSIDKFNEETGSEMGLPEIIARKIEESDQLRLSDVKIKGYFFASDKSRQDHAMQLHKNKKYKYGDRSALDGSEIRATSTDWLKDLSPKQIADIVVPESMDDAFEIYLDLYFGKTEADKIRNSPGNYLIARATYKEIVTTVYGDGGEKINFEEASPEEMKKTRDFVENALSANPEYLAAVKKFGMPPVLATKPSNPDEVNPDELLGWYAPIGMTIMFPTTSFRHLESSNQLLEAVLSAGNSPDSLEARYEIFGGSTSNRAIIHEWAHYLQDMTLGKISQSNNGVIPQSGIKYDPDFDGISNLATILTDQISRDGVRANLSQQDSSMSAKIMQQAENYNNELKEVMEKIQLITISSAFGIGEDVSDLDIPSEIDNLEQQLSDIIKKYDSIGIISAPSAYSTKNEKEQFAEMIAFFMSGPAYRSLLTPTTIKALEKTFSSIIENRENNK